MTNGVPQIELDQLVTQLSDRTGNRSEADLQADIRTLLLYGGLNLGDPMVHLEAPAPNRRRIDIEVGFTVIECKRDLSVGNVREEGVEQLAGYVADRTHQLSQRYSGILTDGAEWELYHLYQHTNELRRVARFDTRLVSSADDLLVWLESVLSTGERLIPTPTEVERRLGANAPGSQLDLAELADIYHQSRHVPDFQLKRELWGRLLAATFGAQFIDDDRLFIEHTYLVLIAEAVAHALMGFDLQHGGVAPRDLVRGVEFRRAGIHGVIEADFFDWPAESEQGRNFIRTLCRRMGRFDWTEVDHDILKILYESVIDPDTRHQLGEYYTPDWLASAIVEEVVDEPLEQRVLDPACGSGTFLFWAVRRHLQASEAQGMSNPDALEAVTRQVFGIDLHPVAVTLARVTYLLAIGQSRLRSRGELSIPVYLGDSIQYAQEARVFSPGGITVYTTDGMELFAQALHFPEQVVTDPARFDQLVEELAHVASNRTRGSQPPTIAALLRRYEVPPGARAAVEEAFRVLCHLHDHNRNHVWGYYIRNLARPLHFSRPERGVDRLVGNPPWLRYNAMTQGLQREYRRLARNRNLWAAAHVVTSQDLAGLFVARTVELYLQRGGRCGFVMPAAVLSRPQYSGFRAGDYTSDEANVGLSFETPWELSRVQPQPFRVPAAVVFGRRVDQRAVRALPQETLWWSGSISSPRTSWNTVRGSLRTVVAPVVVADGHLPCPYGDLVRQGSNLVPRGLMNVHEVPPTGLGLPAGRRSIEVDRSGPERQEWQHLPPVTGVVEEQFLYRWILGESVLPFALRTPRLTVIPFDGERFYRGNELGIDQWPGLADWWREVERLYEAGKPATTRHDLVGQIDYHGKLQQQFPPAPHRLVYTGRGEITTAARLSDPGVIVDHALYWAPTASAAEAQYLCAVLNSHALHRRVADLLSQGLYGGRNIHRACFGVYYPEYDEEEELQRRLARLGAEAEDVADSVDLEGVGHTATARNRIRTALREAGISEQIEEAAEELLEPS